MTDKHDKLVEMATDAGAAHVKPGDCAELFEFERRDLAAFRDRIVASLCADVEPVAFVGEVFSLYWVGAEPVAEIVRKTGVKPGDKLYTASVVAAITAQRDAALARVAELEVRIDQQRRHELLVEEARVERGQP